MRGLLRTRPPLQSNRTLTFSVFQWEQERFGAQPLDPLDSDQTRLAEEFPLPARSGERIKVRGMSNGSLLLRQNDAEGLGERARRGRSGWRPRQPLLQA